MSRRAALRHTRKRHYSPVLPVTLIHRIYFSRAVRDTTDSDLQSILGTSRRNNLARDITGMLLLIEGSFFQVLEGREEQVARTYDIIARDPRHDRVTQIISEPIAQRSFGEWSMGFASVARTDAQRLIGENDFFGGAACVAAINPGRARKLLQAFAAGRWRTDRTGMHRAHARVG